MRIKDAESLAKRLVKEEGCPQVIWRDAWRSCHVWRLWNWKDFHSDLSKVEFVIT